MHKTRFFLLICLLFALPCQAAEKLKVVASFSILGDLCRQLGGDKVEVVTLVGPDGDAHVYQPTPQDGKTVARAKLLVVNGLAYEGWIARLATASGFAGQQLVLSKGIQPRRASHGDAHGHEFDPHAWQDPQRVSQYVANLAEGLASADPSNAAYYQQRAKAYQQQLQQLLQWAQAEIATIAPSKRKLITGHDAFGYLAERFGLTILTPQGINTQAEASAKQVGQLIMQIRREQIRALFVENISNTRLAEQIARETGARTGAKLYSDALSAAGGPAADYLSLMRHNISALVAGMKLNP